MDEIQEQTTQMEETKENELVIDKSAISFLGEIGSWAKFLGILGFIFVGIIVVVALFAGSIFGLRPGFSNLPGGYVLISILYLLIAGFYFFPIYYLFSFATKIKAALTSKNSDGLSEAFKNLKSHYKFMGITTIVVLGIYLIFGLIGGLAFLFMS